MAVYTAVMEYQKMAWATRISRSRVRPPRYRNAVTAVKSRPATMTPVSTSGGRVVIDTGTVVQGPPLGTDTTSQGLEGPHCTTGGGH